MEKRNTVIIAADIVGYSRLVSDNEEAALERIRALFRDVIAPEIDRAQGRVIKFLGDGVLIEALSAQNAVEAALRIQQKVLASQKEQPDETKIRYRIGINSGAAFFTEDDVFGDVVNVAARLESLAQPNEICLSKRVVEQLDETTGSSLVPIGPQYVRNIPAPVEVWRLPTGAGDYSAPSATGTHVTPSIAILPFDSSGATDDLKFLGEALAEDLTTEFARFRTLFVIARNSAFSFRDKQGDLRLIARELGVRYLVTGRVRTAGTKVRVNVDLTDGASGGLIWSGTEQRDYEDIFELQDDLTQEMLKLVLPELSANERAISTRNPQQSLNAWGLCQRGMSEQFKYDADGVRNAFELFTAAREADPKFALPAALLARWHVAHVTTGRSQNVPHDMQTAYALASEAIQLDDRLEDGHAVMGAILGIIGQDVEALAALDRAEALNAHNQYTQYSRTYVHLFQKQIDCAAMEKAALEAIRISPRDPLSWAQYFMLGTARWNYDLHNPANGTQDALDQACSYSNCEFFVYMIAAKFHIRFGDRSTAARYLQTALRKRPDLTLVKWKTFFPFSSWPKMIADTEKELEILVEMGLPKE